MKQLLQCFLIPLYLLLLLSSGCVLTENLDLGIKKPSSVVSYGPYWEGPAAKISINLLLDYRQRIQQLSKAELATELSRISAIMPESRRTAIDLVQLIMLHSVKSSPAEIKSAAKELFNRNPAIPGDAKELLHLIKDMASVQLASQLQENSCNKSLLAAQQTVAKLESDVDIIRQEAKLLSDQLEKLREIERIMVDRERNASPNK